MTEHRSLVEQPDIDLSGAEFRDYQGPMPWSKRDWDFSQLISAASVRGLTAIVVSLILLRVPNQTPRVFGYLIAALLVSWALGGLTQLRDPTYRTALDFSRIVVLLVLALGLVFWPAFTAEELGRAAGVVLIIGGLLNGYRGWRREGRGRRVELLLGATLYIVIGVALLVSPETILGLSILLVSTYWFLAGVATLVVNLRSEDDRQISPSQTWREFLSWVQGRPETADDRRQLYEKIFYEGTDARRRLSRFFTLMGFATAIASWGIIADSTAVVIGAMLVAPLMTPLMGTSLAMVMGWPRRVSISGTVALGGVLFAVGLSLVFGWMYGLTVNPELNTQVATRVGPTLVDLAIAIAAGGAGAFALSRPDVSDSLPGVAVAIALVPPLAVVGLMISQNDWSEALGALILFTTNLVAILVIGGAVFVVTGVVPLLQLTQNSRRIKLSLGMVGILAIGVIAVLGASTETFQDQVTGKARANTVVDQWLAGTDLVRVSSSVTADSLTVTVQGPEAPPPVEILADDLEAEFDMAVAVTVKWLPQTEFAYEPPDR